MTIVLYATPTSTTIMWTDGTTTHTLTTQTQTES